jgi:hypothetical protein
MTTVYQGVSVVAVGDVDITGDISASGTINTVGISSAADATAITITSAEDVGIGIATPDGQLHVHTATAGAITAHANADDLVIENSVAGGLSLLTPDAVQSRIAFGSPSDNQGSAIDWSFDTLLLRVATREALAEISLRTGDNVEAVRIDGSQNVGIGVSNLEAWNSIYTAVQIGGNASVLGKTAAGTNSGLWQSQNAYLDSGGWKYISGDEASSYMQTSGAHTFRVISSGSPDASITWNDAVVIDNDGDVGIGIATPDGTLHVHTATAGTVTANTAADDLVVENSAAGGVSILGPDSISVRMAFGSPSINMGTQLLWNHDADLFAIDTIKVGAFIRISTGDAVEAMRIDASQNVVIGNTVAAGKLDVDQASATGAIPVLYLDQADVSEEFIRFDAVEATGNSVEDVAAKALTTTKFLRINVNGTDLYLQAGTIA